MCGHHPLHHLPIYQPYPYHPASAVNYPPPPAEARVSAAPCPGCGNAVQEDFVFCPRCGAEVLTACPACHRAVRADWTHCAFCGADLMSRPEGFSKTLRVSER